MSQFESYLELAQNICMNSLIYRRITYSLVE